MSNVLELTTELTARPSITPDDAGCQRLIAERLLPLGFNVEWFLCGEVSNVLFTHVGAASSRESHETSPSLWFLGHTDVVPPGPEELWTFLPFHPDQKGGELYGRGVADMKGAVAAMVVALETFTRQHPDHGGQIGLLLTSDEEGAAVDGIIRVAEELKRRGAWPDHCLVGEPSSQERLGDTVRVGRRGSIYVRLKVNGIQGHTAFPENLDNPVHAIAPFLDELVALHSGTARIHQPKQSRPVSASCCANMTSKITRSSGKSWVSLSAALTASSAKPWLLQSPKSWVSPRI